MPRSRTSACASRRSWRQATFTTRRGSRARGATAATRPPPTVRPRWIPARGSSASSPRGRSPRCAARATPTRPTCCATRPTSRPTNSRSTAPPSTAWRSPRAPPTSPSAPRATAPTGCDRRPTRVRPSTRRGSWRHARGVVEEYKKSVHYAALMEKNDLSAPTCKSCHGAHGATPPGVDSVANVCGTCHVSQLEKFDQSPHKDAFAALQQPACEACHSNHAIGQPQDSWIGVADKQVCGACHSAGDAGATAATAISGALASTVAAEASVGARVARVKRAGMLMDAADVKLEDAHQAYIMATVEIHTAIPARVEKQTATALADTSAADKDAAAAEKEIRYRRTGLFVSLVVIAIAMVTLAFKVRSMER
ncbi:MAG: hypothetical protein B7Z68_09370 [Acidobacteria bacterium 21-70-11]|nr:MAG: hypothetical protein B7Z68_09370 [Acidobacteria bacterium 21-70-11]